MNSHPSGRQKLRSLAKSSVGEHMKGISQGYLEKHGLNKQRERERETDLV